MKFLYEYRTSGNELRSGSVAAVSRDGAFAALKAVGIRPVRVMEAPGFFNKLFGKGKRWLAIAVLAIAVAALFLAVNIIGADYRAAREEVEELSSPFDSTTRRQIIGDTAVIEKGIATGWSDVFPREGERFLASFAIPGVPAGLRSTTESELRDAISRPTVASVDSLESRQIVAIVDGMKKECREFLADGSTFVEYGNALVRRQEMEISYYQRAKSELDTAWASKMPRDEFLALWEDRNSQLRRIGVRLVPLPED